MTVDPELSPRISVVCPTYNSELFIGRTISSILAQTRLPVEIVLVDDGSKDGTLASLNAAAFTHPEVRWQILHGAQRGPGAARNRGIGAAIGDWVAFLDSDDLWLPAKLEMVARAIQSNSVVNVVCHGEISRDQAGNERPLALGDLYQPGIPLARQLYRRNFFSTSAVVCRRELLLTAGLFDETLSSVQDYELWLRMAADQRPSSLLPHSAVAVRPRENSERLQRRSFGRGLVRCLAMVVT